MGLGAKILFTGALFFALSCVIILLYSDSVIKISYWAKAILILTCWYGGLAAMIIGTLIAIWM